MKYLQVRTVSHKIMTVVLPFMGREQRLKERFYRHCPQFAVESVEFPFSPLSFNQFGVKLPFP